MNKRGKKLTLITMATIMPVISMNLPVSQITTNKILLVNNDNGNNNENAKTDKNLEQESKVFSAKISSAKINIINVWNGPILTIGFNKNDTFNISNGGNYLNPYYKENNALTIQLTEPNGKIIYNQNFAGAFYPYKEVSEALNNKTFKYGDIISIVNRSGGSFEVNGMTKKNTINYVITPNGLEKLNTNSIRNLTAYYNGDNTTVTGNTTPNTLVTLWAGDKSYISVVGSSGTFKFTLPTSVKPNTNLRVCPYKKLGENVTVAINPNIFKLQKSNIELYGSWGSAYKFANIGFNTYTMKFNAKSPTNPYLSWNSSSQAYALTLYDKQGAVIATKSFDGAVDAQQFNEWMNNLSFKYGDYFSIKSYGMEMSIDGKPMSEKNIFVQITKNGLVNIQQPKLSIPENSLIINTFSNAKVNIEINEKKYNILSNSNGEAIFKIPKNVKEGTPIIVSVNSENIDTMPIIIKRPATFYGLDGNSIELYGSWGGAYKFINIKLSTSTMKFSAKSPYNPRMSGGSSLAYTIGLYNKKGDLIETKSFTGLTTANEFEQWIDNIGFKYGDYLSVKSSGLEMSFNGQALTENNIFVQITRAGLVSCKEPKVAVIANKVNIISYDNARANIEILGKKYSVKTNSQGKTTFIIPNDITIGTPISISVKCGKIDTMPVTVYSTYTNATKDFSYNMFRYASISPASNMGTKGDDMTLTSLEPIPLQFSGSGKVMLDVKGDINGSAVVYLNNGANRIYLKTIKTNTPTLVTVPSSGAIIVDTSNVDYDGNKDTEFNFKIDANVQSGYYKSIPVFDNRGFIKIDSEATSNEAEFNKEIFNPVNRNSGAIMIGNHVRIYVSNASASLPTTLNASNTVNWYNEAFISDNELNGLSQTATSQLNKFHTNFLYATTSTTDPGDGWFTGGGGTSSIPGMFKIGLTTPGWVMFHEIGHVFDPDWADSFGGSEIYSNMYTAETQLKIEHIASWGQGQAGYNKINTLPIFEKYAKGYPPQKYMNMNTGLEYFKLLHEYFPTMMPKIDNLYRQQWYNKDLPYKGVNYLVYAMATIYHTNVIPSLDMWGCKITNQNLIKYVIEKSNSTTNLVPSESYFDTYKNMTVPVTFLSPQMVGNNYIISGMVNPNAKLTVQYGGKDYTTTCDNTGKFTIEFPKGKDTIAKIYGQADGKTKGYVSVIPLSKAFIDGNKSFNITSTNGCGGILATLAISPEGKLDFISIGNNPNWQAPKNPYFMNMEVTTPNDKVIYNQNIYMHSNFSSAESFLEGKKFPIGTIITVSAPTSNNQAEVSCSSKSTGTIDLKPTAVGSVNKWDIVITEDGLEYLKSPEVNITNITKVLNINTLPSSNFEITVGGKAYSRKVGSNGKVSIDLPKGLKAGEKVNYKVELGSKILINQDTTVKAFNSTLTINNVWNESMADITFNYKNNKIEVAQGGGVVNPYLSGEAFKISLENSKGDVIKSMTADGKQWIETKTSNEFNGLNFKVGDRLVIQYDTSSLLSFNDIITANGVKAYDVKKSTIVYVTDQGLSLIKPKVKLKVNKTALEDVIKEGTKDIDSKKYSNESIATLKTLIQSGKNLLTNSKVTQANINNKVNEINNAIQELKPNERQLKEEVAQAQLKIKSKEYTPISIDNLDNIINDANKVIANKNATVAQVQNIEKSLDKAMDTLVHKANIIALKKAVEEGTTDISNGKYTLASIEALKDEIARAKVVMTNNNATQIEVNNAENSIIDAIKKLEKVTIKPENHNNHKKTVIKPVNNHNKSINESMLKTHIELGNKDVSAGIYTPDSTQILQKAINKANSIINSKNIIQESVDNANQGLIKALHSLVIRGNKENLEKAIEKAKSYENSNNYTTDSINNLKKVVDSASIDLNNLNLNQNEVNNAIKNISEAIGNLKTNETGLKGDIAKANAIIGSGKYTPNSIKSLKIALKNANDVIRSKDATPMMVHKAKDEINQSIKLLVNRANVSNLREVIDNAQKDLNSSIYTSESTSDLLNKVNVGESLLSNANATQIEVNNAENSIIDAINKLEKVTIKPENHNNHKKPVIKPANNHNKSINESMLKTHIELGNKDVNAGIYTPDSTQILQKAINKANSIINSKNITQESVDNANQGLIKALHSLVIRGNKENLEKAIEKAKSYENSNNYTTDSINNLKKVVDSASIDLNNLNLNQNEVNNAIKNISEAIGNLKTNETGLKGDIAKANAIIGSSKYTPNSIKSLKIALKNANDVIRSKDTTPTMVHKAKDEINQSIKLLVNRANVSDLREVIDNAQKDLNSSIYTSESTSDLLNKVNVGESLLSNANATQIEVNNASANIENAINNLVKKEIVKKPKGNNEKTNNINSTNKSISKTKQKISQVNTLELKRAIEVGENDINSGDYTQESIKALKNQIALGENILNNANATQAEINGAVKEIDIAIKELKIKIPKEVVDHKGENKVVHNINKITTKNEVGLKDEIAKAKTKLKDNKYNQSTIQNIQKVINQGNEILNNPNSTQSEINSAQTRISNSLDKLPQTGIEGNGKESIALGALGTLAAMLGAIFIFRKKR